MLRLLKAARAFFILLPLHLALAARGVAQETARVDEPAVVAGVVRDGSSNPVRDAVVTIVDLGRSTRTDDAGVFRLELPAAAGGRELVLRVSLGRLAETEVRVVAGTGTTWRDVVLDVPVVPLQAVVATAVGVADHRAQPARIGRVDAVSVVESAPVATMTELLQARMPGLSVTRASGAPGAASQIRTRGVGPLRFPGGPAVYVDGVRVDAGPRESMLVVAPATSGLDDLSPHDIESVEVLAGPAAAARYGPDAVTGVIAVRTRRAPVGEQPFRQQIAAGYGRTEVAAAPPDNWARCTDASVPVCEGLAAGTLVSDNPLMREGGYREGRRASIHWSGRGGGANYGFSMGLGLETEDGYLPATGLDRRNGHASLVLVPTERLRVEAGIGRAVSKVEPVLAEGYAGLIGLGMLGSPLTVSGPADGWWGTPGEIFATAESRIEAERTTPTLRLAHTTLPWLTQRLTAGADLVRQSGRQAFPWIEEWPDLEGQFADAKRRSDVYTVDYLATAEVPLESPDVSDSRLSLGVQYLRESSRRSGTEGVRTDPPTDSEPFEWTEREIEWRTAGVLAQWDIGYRDRLFARVGARVDWMRLEYRDSAYAGATGSPSSSSASYAKDDPDPVVAPYVGVSYLVSNTSFWAPIAPVVGTLRLHGAWGRARRKHPDLEVQDFDDDILFMLSTISAARPETVNEFELGAEAGLLDDRLGIGITYFHRTTSDIALLIPSSLGLGVGRVGYGEVVDRGFELDLTARLLRGSALSWTVDAMLRTLDNEVESIGSD
ncbi:MAG TPA: TonB-dependent receptor, partial [Longimicrobiales bacterium]